MRKRIRRLPVGMFRQIALVEQDELDSIRRVLLEIGRLRRIAIDDVKKEIGGGERLLGALDSLAFEFIRRIRAARPCRAIESECPRRFITSSMVSRVVPGSSLTIARS